MKTSRQVQLFLLLFLIISPMVLSLQAGSQSSSGRELPLLSGKVVDKETLKGFFNYTIVFERENLIPVLVRTNKNGEYNVTLPLGEYTVYVYTAGETVYNRSLVWKTSLSVVDGPDLVHDFLIDPEDIVKSHLRGYVMDKEWDEPVEGAEIRLIRHSFINITRTTKNGSFSIFVYPGEYTFQIFYKGKERFNTTMVLDWGQNRNMSIEIDTQEDRPIVTWEDVRNFLEDHWIDIILLVGMVIGIILAYIILMSVLNFFKKRKWKFLEAEWFTAVQRFVNRIAILGVVLAFTWQLSNMVKPIKDYVWSWMRQVAGPIAGIFAVLLFSRVLLLMNTKLWEYLRSRRGKDGKNVIPLQLITMLEIVLRYLIFIVAGAVIFILVLSAFGLNQQIGRTMGNFFSDNAGKLGFLIILVVVAVLMKRFGDIFFKELKTRSTKVNPEIMEMTHKGTMGLMYFVIALIFMFTLLSIGGLGDIGQTFILVISMIIGLVVSFAATGSIGNMLSGLVLMSMRPFNVNDRVQLTGVIGDVVAIGIMFTTLRDLDGNLYELPNNNVLGASIINYTRAVKEGDMAVVVDVGLGYDINPKVARSLMKRAALVSPGVVKDPPPRVLVRTFHDHAVEYRLRAYIDNPSNMMYIRSSVMESMLYAFHSEGLEVMSPHQLVRRVSQTPTREELDQRTRYHEEKVEKKEPAAEGLTMFDIVEGRIGK
ncbi:MAG: mechanosensitive ion channel domain-containing protein [Thermoplasmatota archaeon]